MVVFDICLVSKLANMTPAWFCHMTSTLMHFLILYHCEDSTQNIGPVLILRHYVYVQHSVFNCYIKNVSNYLFCSVGGVNRC